MGIIILFIFLILEKTLNLSALDIALEEMFKQSR